MLPVNNYQHLDNNEEFLIERPVGWSSACLDSTIDYYLNCEQDELLEDRQLKNNTVVL